MLMKHYLSISSTSLLVMFLILFCGTSFIHAQNDSIETGVMKVRRPPVPSRYFVDLSYSYSPAKQGFLGDLFKRRNNGFDGYLPPEPVTVVNRGEDSTRAIQDSSFMIRFYEKEDRPGEPFAWIEWLNQYEHQFAWNDTAGIDSAVFVYTINPRGQIKLFSLGAEDKKDSSAVALRNGLLPYMRKLWIWYPATTIQGDTGRRRKANCTVTVKVYAIREDHLQRMPLKIVD